MIVITIVSAGLFFDIPCVLYSDNTIQSCIVAGGPGGGGLL